VKSAWAAAAILIVTVTLPQDPRPTFRAGVDVVTVPVAVLAGNRPVAAIPAAEFELLDNGVAQAIAATPLHDAAIDVTLVLDASGSLHGAALARLKHDVQDITRDLRASDRVRVLTFGDTVETIVPFTPGGVAVDLDRIEGAGATSLYAALAAALITDPAAALPQLAFVLTDGRDNASYLNAGAVLRLAGQSNACLYVALVDSSEAAVRYDASGAPAASSEESTIVRPVQKGLYDGVAALRRTTGPYAGGPNLPALRGIAARTGGGVYEHSSGRLHELFARALDEFRSSYLLSYVPSAATAGWHDITVRVKSQRYTIRARKGYQR
jgi:VWFA-related protein